MTLLINYVAPILLLLLYGKIFGFGLAQEPMLGSGRHHAVSAGFQSEYLFT